MTKLITMIAGGCVVLSALAMAQEGGRSAASQPGSKLLNVPKLPKAGDNLDFWMNQADPNGKAGAPDPASKPVSANPFPRKDALPGVVEMSDGNVLAGYMFTTLERNWEVYTAGDKRWHLVPFISLLSITAVVDEEGMEQKWRWKEMGVPERVYTGEAYPFRRLSWKVHLLDDTTMAGGLKGQPLWVVCDGKKYGPYVMAERMKGEIGQKLTDVVYVKRIIVSKRLMEEVQKDQLLNPPKKAGK